MLKSNAEKSSVTPIEIQSHKNKSSSGFANKYVGRAIIPMTIENKTNLKTTSDVDSRVFFALRGTHLLQVFL